MMKVPPIVAYNKSNHSDLKHSKSSNDKSKKVKEDNNNQSFADILLEKINGKK